MLFHYYPWTEAMPIAPALDQFELRPMDWNDWFEFRTSFAMYWVSNGHRFDVGGIKIAKLDFTYQNLRGGETPLPADFDALDPTFVSVAQDESFYRNLIHYVGRDRARQVLTALHDLSVSLGRYDEVVQHRVVSQSLLRSVSPSAVRETFPAILADAPTALTFDFSFSQPQTNPFMPEPVHFDFRVERESVPPTNIHVLIGRNGSGKTTILRSMARSLLGAPFVRPADGRFTFSHVDGGHAGFANLVYVGFSAFDRVEVPVTDTPVAYDTPYVYIGLQQLESSRRGSVEDQDTPEFVTRHDPAQSEDPEAAKITRPSAELANEFAKSAWIVASGKSLELWRDALEILETDPNFEGADVSSLAQVDRTSLDGRIYRAKARELYEDKLSSGHRIVLLTITRLVETVTDRTLVLMDEPEGHLHPPLLAAFVRAVSGLLRQRNAAAIVATHSPVILQEVIRDNAYLINRNGDVWTRERPPIETFGENVGALTHTAFGLEVLASGYSRLLLDAAADGLTYEQIETLFRNHLGFEARAILRNWLANGDRDSIARLARED